MWRQLPLVRRALYPLEENIPDGLVGLRGFAYDVSDLDHPGGNLFLKLVSGTDCTALFETHHVNIVAAEKALEKCRCVCRYKQCKDIPTDFSSYKRLRAEVYTAFPTRASRKMPFREFLRMAAWITSAFFVHFTLLYLNPFTFTWLLLCVLSAVLNTICGGYGHNAIHRLDPAAILLDWNGLSSYEWLHEHISSHHPFVNTEFDHDAISMEPFVNWLPERPKGLLPEVYGKHLIYAIAEIVVCIQGLIVHRVRWKVPEEAPIWLKYAPLVFIFRICTCIMFSQTRLASLANLLVPMFIASYVRVYGTFESRCRQTNEP